jgi:hypothetical protein
MREPDTEDLDDPVCALNCCHTHGQLPAACASFTIQSGLGTTQRRTKDAGKSSIMDRHPRNSSLPSPSTSAGHRYGTSRRANICKMFRASLLVVASCVMRWRAISCFSVPAHILTHNLKVSLCPFSNIRAIRILQDTWSTILTRVFMEISMIWTTKSIPPPKRLVDSPSLSLSHYYPI